MLAKCKNCGKDFEMKQVSQKFCSNHGRGNCKDKYHNRMKKYTKYKKYNKNVVSEKDYFIMKEDRKKGRCLQCGRKFVMKHVSQKFCSNHGRGNCKDKYHNRVNATLGKVSYSRMKYLEREDYSQFEYEDEYDFVNF